MSTLEQAIQFAHAQHEGQTDKAGQPYITHPLRVMHNVVNTDAKMAAVMHDVLEDTDAEVSDFIRLGFSKAVIDAVIAVTKTENDSRFSAAQRTVKNAIACQVKLTDLADNMDLSRLKQITAKDLVRFKQYQQVRQIILEADQIYSFMQQFHLPYAYPVFEYSRRSVNYHYLLNLMLDLRHPRSGLNVGLAQEWSILFEDCAAYFSWCKRHARAPDAHYAMQLIQSTDQQFFDGYFSDALSMQIMSKILKDIQNALLLPTECDTLSPQSILPTLS